MSFQINHQPDATIFQFIILTFIYSSTCFGVFPPIIRSSMTAVAASGFTFVSWWQLYCVCGRAGRPAGPTTNTPRLSLRYEGKTRGCHCIHWAPDGGRENPETCWAVNKRQDNKLKNRCIWLVIYLNCTVMIHGLTNLKLKKKEYVGFRISSKDMCILR